MTDRLLGAACIVVAAAMAWAAHGYAAAFSYEPVGPRAFPLLLSVLMALGGMVLVARPSAGPSPYAGVPAKALLLCVCTVLAYALGFEVLGFPLVTALMTVPVGMAFGGSAWKSLGGGALLGLVLFFMFDRWLDVVLPAGWLAPLLQGL